MTLYYSNGGPGPATRLVRIDAPEDGDWDTWYYAPGFKWTAAGMIDESEVERVQQEIRDWIARYS